MKAHHSGSILITTLWIMAILSLLAMGIGFRASLEARLTRYSLDKLEAGYLAKAGIVEAEELLAPDKSTLYECGIKLNADMGYTAEGIFKDQTIELPEEQPNRSFSVYYTEKSPEGERKVYGIQDEEKRINIKLSKWTPEAYMSIMGSLCPELTPDIISAMIDWQDQDSNIFISTDGNKGAEYEDYYRTLPHSYQCKNADFDCIEELMLVKGMTPEIFEKIKDNITVYGDGKVNINTAPEKVLYAMVYDGTPELAEAIVNAIITTRRGDDGTEGTFDDFSITDLTKVMENLGTNVMAKARLTSVSGRFAFKSKYFRIISYGKVNRITRRIDCVVEKPSQDQLNLLEYREE